MSIFNLKEKKSWKQEYINNLNEVRKKYEEKLQKKQNEIEQLRSEVQKFKTGTGYLRPKEKQIKESDIQDIKKLRKEGMSYREISNKTSWSKATVSRVINGMYD